MAIAAMRPEYKDLGTNDTRGPGHMATDRVRGERSEPDNNSQPSGMAVLILPRTLVAAVRRQHGSRAVSAQPLPCIYLSIYPPKPLSCIIFSDGVIATVSSRARLVLLLSSSISSAHASSQIWRKYAPKPLFSIIFGAGVIVTVSIFFSCLAFVLKCLVFVCSRIISNLETVCTRTRLQHHLQCRSDRELCCVVLTLLTSDSASIFVDDVNTQLYLH